MYDCCSYTYTYIQAPVQPVPGTLSLNALNDVVLDEDISLILNKLSVNNVKLSEILDSFNNTVTHIAAYAGRKRLVETLLRYIKATDDDNHMENAFGQSPQLLAELGGFNDIARLFGNPLPSVREEFVRINKSLVNEFQHINWKKYKRSGWTVKSESLNVLKESYPLCSEVLPVIQELTHQSMSHRTPLLIHSDEILDWKAWSKWRKKDILNRYVLGLIPVCSGQGGEEGGRDRQGGGGQEGGTGKGGGGKICNNCSPFYWETRN